jgi:hypothetical protein
MTAGTLLGYDVDIGKDSNSQRVDFTPKFGFGRIENVTNAWHTKSILEILQRENLLLRELSHDEITTLAEEMTRIKNTRVIDFRFDDIYEYEKILSYLFENGIADPNEYKFFSVFQDAWRYEAFRFRSQGSTLKIGPESIFERYDLVLFEEIIHSHSLNAQYTVNRNKQDWFFGYQLEVNYGKQFSNYSRNSVVSYASTSVTIGNYLSSRTYAELTANYFANHILEESRDFESNLFVRGRVEYFISPRFKLDWVVNYDLFNTTFQNGKRLFVNIGADYILR